MARDPMDHPTFQKTLEAHEDEIFSKRGRQPTNFGADMNASEPNNQSWIGSKTTDGYLHTHHDHKTGKITHTWSHTKVAEEEELEEISKARLGKYIKAASNDMANAQVIKGETARAYPNDPKAGSEHKRVEDKRRKGISKAVEKLTKEEQEVLDELNYKAILQRYRAKAKAKMRADTADNKKKPAPEKKKAVNEEPVEYYDALERKRKAEWHYKRAGKTQGASLSKGIKHDYESELLRRGVKDSNGNQKSLRKESLVDLVLTQDEIEYDPYREDFEARINALVDAKKEEMKQDLFDMNEDGREEAIKKHQAEYDAKHAKRKKQREYRDNAKKKRGLQASIEAMKAGGRK